MKIIPAIDLKDGLCVRLLQGKSDAVTVYSNNPVEIAQRWVNQGADMIHIVDLDGAFSGEQKNLEGIKQIRDAVGAILEVGGGIRRLEVIDNLVTLGIDRVILGSAVLEDPDLLKEACLKHPGRIIVGIDAKNEKVAIKGWVEVTEKDAKELAQSVEDSGVSAIIYTDIHRDGMLKGPNINGVRDMVESVNIPVIASGGVSSIDDIERLKGIKDLYGAIVGKALYTGGIGLREAIEFVR